MDGIVCMFFKTYIAIYKIEISIVTDEGKSSLNSLLPLAAHLRFN